MLFASLVLVGIAAGISLIASAIAAASHFLTRSYALSLTLGTLTMPALLLASFTYWLMTMEADDAPPGTMIIGNLTAIGIVTPIALLASLLTLKLLARRAPRKGG